MRDRDTFNGSIGLGECIRLIGEMVSFRDVGEM